MVLCVSAVDFSLDKWMPLILKKIFPSHCQKNIITGYCLRRPPFHLCYTHKAWGDTATVRFPKSSLSNLPAPPDLRQRTCQNVLLAFPVPVFISLPLLPSALLHFLQKSEKFAQCPELCLQTMPSSSLPSFLSVLSTQVESVLRSNCFKGFNLQTFP